MIGTSQGGGMLKVCQGIVQRRERSVVQLLLGESELRLLPNIFISIVSSRKITHTKKKDTSLHTRLRYSQMRKVKINYKSVN